MAMALERSLTTVCCVCCCCCDDDDDGADLTRAWVDCDCCLRGVVSPLLLFISDLLGVVDVAAFVDFVPRFCVDICVVVVVFDCALDESLVLLLLLLSLLSLFLSCKEFEGTMEEEEDAEFVEPEETAAERAALMEVDAAVDAILLEVFTTLDLLLPLEALLDAEAMDAVDKLETSFVIADLGEQGREEEDEEGLFGDRTRAAPAGLPGVEEAGCFGGRDRGVEEVEDDETLERGEETASVCVWELGVIGVFLIEALEFFVGVDDDDEGGGVDSFFFVVVVASRLPVMLRLTLEPLTNGDGFCRREFASSLSSSSSI